MKAPRIASVKREVEAKAPRMASVECEVEVKAPSVGCEAKAKEMSLKLDCIPVGDQIEAAAFVRAAQERIAAERADAKAVMQSRALEVEVEVEVKAASVDVTQIRVQHAAQFKTRKDMEKMDTNTDGGIEKSEFLAAGGTQEDLNRDGVLSADEMRLVECEIGAMGISLKLDLSPRQARRK